MSQRGYKANSAPVVVKVCRESSRPAYYCHATKQDHPAWRGYLVVERVEVILRHSERGAHCWYGDLPFWVQIDDRGEFFINIDKSIPDFTQHGELIHRYRPTRTHVVQG